MLKTCSTQSHEELITWQPFAHAQISSSDQLTLSEMLCWRSPVCLKPAVVCAMCRKLRVFGWNIPSGLRAEAVKRVGEYRGASVSDVVTPWGYIDKQAAGSSSKLTLHETGLFCCHWFFLLSFPWYRIKEWRFLFMWHSVCLIKRRVAI